MEWWKIKAMFWRIYYWCIPNSLPHRKKMSFKEWIMVDYESSRRRSDD